MCLWQYEHIFHLSFIYSLLLLSISKKIHFLLSKKNEKAKRKEFNWIYGIISIDGKLKKRKKIHCFRFVNERKIFPSLNWKLIYRKSGINFIHEGRFSFPLKCGDKRKETNIRIARNLISNLPNFHKKIRSQCDKYSHSHATASLLLWFFFFCGIFCWILWIIRFVCIFYLFNSKISFILLEFSFISFEITSLLVTAAFLSVLIKFFLPFHSNSLQLYSISLQFSFNFSSFKTIFSSLEF